MEIVRADALQVDRWLGLCCASLERWSMAEIAYIRTDAATTDLAEAMWDLKRRG